MAIGKDVERDAAVAGGGPGRHGDLVRRFVEAIERADGDAFAALFAEDAVGHHPFFPEPLQGREAIRASEQGLFDSFSDIHVEVRSVLADHDRCAMEVVLRATNTGPLDVGGEDPVPATHRTVEIPAVWWCEVRDDGLIVEERDYLDTAAFMAQLGLGPQ